MAKENATHFLALKKTEVFKTMNKNTVIVIVLLVLVFVTVVQTFKLFQLKNQIASGGLKVGSSTQGGASQTGQGAGNVQVPSSIQNLPSMVGGC